ncbi:MAG TPA: hypothetical protein VFP59_11410 [Candidatus Angelobacter sp.]|nr:hypothetical protein [Candidatus Angelobacter sp.]
MHPKLKREAPSDRPSPDPGSGAPILSAPENPNEFMPSTERFAVDGAESQARKRVTADQFAYLRAQVHVFRRSY